MNTLFEEFENEEMKKARQDYNTMIGEGILEETAGVLLAEAYGEAVAKKIVAEAKGWD